VAGYFTKLDSGITDSTIWLAPDTTRIVWITMMAMADQNGYVGSSLPGLASRARVSMPACVEAIKTFLAPDEYSRTADFEGRRITEADGGWVLLNHAKYRAKISAADKRERSRLAMAALRARRKEEANNRKQLTPVTPRDPALTLLAQAEADNRSREEQEKNTHREKFSEVERPDDMPEQVWTDWLRIRRKKKAPLTKTAWEGVKREAAIAGLTPAEAVLHAAESGWQGFKAEWLKRDTAKSGTETMSFAERATEAKAQRIAELTGGMANTPLRSTKREVIDVDATEIHARRLA
jgi:hypothetical protein